MVTTNVITAKKKLSEFLEMAQREEVVITANNKPKAIILGYEHFNNLLDYIEDIEDQLALIRADHVPQEEYIPLDQVLKELQTFT